MDTEQKDTINTGSEFGMKKIIGIGVSIVALIILFQIGRAHV